jgi:predicted aspartyl protease
MGLTYVDLLLYNPRRDEAGRRQSFLVDSGAVYSVVPETILVDLGCAATRTERFTLANGEIVERGVGEVGFRLNDRAATSPVVFGDAADVFLLGAVTLETLGFVLDPFRRELRPLRMMLA